LVAVRTRLADFRGCGLNPLNGSDATQEPDHDGLSNRDESALGYDPTVADYVFADGFETGNTGRWT
jgi:hypothetical protein